MPVALCKSCGRHVHWRSTRGSRLADIRCRDCGSAMVRARFDWDLKAYVAVGEPPEKADQSAGDCHANH